MKSFKHIMGAAALSLIAGGALTSCQNDFDQPPLKEPTATMTPNTTIAELKAANWQNDDNYYLTLGKTADGEDMIIRGRVISSDATGNIYKSLVIQDETAALSFSINQSGINNDYRLGQEIVVKVTDLGFGKYRGLQQIGGYGEYNGTPQTSFMDYNVFQEHTELNHFPDPKYTIVEPGQEAPADGKMYVKVVDLGNLPTTPSEIQKTQSQLVLLRNVHFELGGQAPFSEDDASTNRNLLDDKGNSIIVRNSNYASFHAKTLPAGTGDVMGILSYFGSDWQIMLRSEADCMFESKGQKDDPYTVAEAIKEQGQGKSGWVSGYIVGSVKAGVTDIDSNDKVIWGADAEMDNTLVIAAEAGVKDINDCLVFALPQGSDLRAKGNLIDNPGNLGKQIKIRGTFDSFLGANGIIDNPGTADSFEIEGQGGPVGPGEGVGALSENFDASTSIPAGWLNVQLKGTKNWFIKEFSGNNYASMTGYKGTAPFDSWLISPAIDCSKMTEKKLSFHTQVNGYGSTTTKFNVYVLSGSSDPATAQKTLLNPALPTAPASGYSSWVNSGDLDLSGFSGIIYIGFQYEATTDANYATWCVDDVVVGEGGAPGPVDPPVVGGKGTEEDPYTVGDVRASSADATGVWIEGYVVGWISGMTWATGASFNNTPTSDFGNTNFILGPDADANSTSTTIPCAIPAGPLRDTLGLGKNPAIYKKHVIVKGDITKYFGQRGVKNITEYKEL